MSNVSFTDVLAYLETINANRSIWKTGVWKPGVWEHTVLDEVLQNAE